MQPDLKTWEIRQRSIEYESNRQGETQVFMCMSMMFVISSLLNLRSLRSYMHIWYWGVLLLLFTVACLIITYIKLFSHGYLRRKHFQLLIRRGIRRQRSWTRQWRWDIRSFKVRPSSMPIGRSRTTIFRRNRVSVLPSCWITKEEEEKTSPFFHRTIKRWLLWTNYTRYTDCAILNLFYPGDSIPFTPIDNLPRLRLHRAAWGIHRSGSRVLMGLIPTCNIDALLNCQLLLEIIICASTEWKSSIIATKNGTKTGQNVTHSRQVCPIYFRTY